MPKKGNHIITAATEHKAVLDTCKKLEKNGYRVTYLPVKGDGLIDLDMLRESITDKTILVTIMYANNEIGVLQPVAEIGKICREKGVLFHTDGVQAIGKVPVDVNRDNIDLMSITAHKLYGPKGVGALYVRRKNPRVQLTAWNGWRRTRAWHAFGHAQRSEHCGSRRSLRDLPARNAGRDEAPAACAISCGTSWNQNWMKFIFERIMGAPPAAQPESELCVCGRRIAVDGHQRCRCFERIGLHLRDARTKLCIKSSRPRRRHRALVDPVWHWPFQHGRRRSDYVADKLIHVVRKLRELSPLYEMAKEGIDLSKVSWVHD